MSELCCVLPPRPPPHTHTKTPNRIVKLVRAIRKGWLQVGKRRSGNTKEQPVYLMWGDDDQVRLTCYFVVTFIKSFLCGVITRSQGWLLGVKVGGLVVNLEPIHLHTHLRTSTHPSPWCGPKCLCVEGEGTSHVVQGCLVAGLLESEDGWLAQVGGLVVERWGCGLKVLVSPTPSAHKPTSQTFNPSNCTHHHDHQR